MTDCGLLFLFVVWCLMLVVCCLLLVVCSSLLGVCCLLLVRRVWLFVVCSALYLCGFVFFFHSSFDVC